MFHFVTFDFWIVAFLISSLSRTVEDAGPYSSTPHSINKELFQFYRYPRGPSGTPVPTILVFTRLKEGNFDAKWRLFPLTTVAPSEAFSRGRRGTNGVGGWGVDAIASLRFMFIQQWNLVQHRTERKGITLSADSYPSSVIRMDDSFMGSPKTFMFLGYLDQGRSLQFWLSLD